VGQYKHLSEGERRVIATMKRNKASIRSIAKVIGRSPSTICHELRRNLHNNGNHTYYTYSMAQSKAMGRRHRCRPNEAFSPKQWDTVDDLIRADWSPEQISHTLKRSGKLTISHETIYQHIYKDMKAGGTLYNHLRHRFRKKRKRYRKIESRGRLAGKRMIGERPQDINERQGIGHWEIDTVMGKGSTSCVVTIVERKTGYVYIGLLKERTMNELNACVIRIIKGSRMAFLSITADNGTEFHGYKQIESETKVVFYFATPHHAWERGTNENTNGLIRQYLPKRQSMRWITQETCNLIAYKLNTRPRKRLEYQSPSQCLVGAA